MQDVDNVDKIKEELATEVARLRQRIAELETAETERKRAEEVLKRSEQEKAAVFDSISEHVVYQDTKMRILWANRAAGESVSVEPQQLVGRHCYEIWPQRRKPCVGCPVVKARKSGQPQEAEITTPDGRIWLISGYPVRDTEGNVTGAVEVTREITELKQAEVALRESEERFRKFADEASFEGIILHREDKIVDVNEQFLKMHGYERTELIGMNSLIPIAPEYREIVRKYIQDGYEKPYEAVALRKDGSTFPIEIRGKTIPYHGKIVRVGAVQDITKRKRAEKALRESEKRFRRVVETMKVGLSAIDENGVLTYVNEYYAKMLRYSIDEMIGRPTLDFHYYEQNRKEQEEIFKKRRAGLRDLTPYEVTCRRKDGQKVYSIVSPTPSFDADGRYTGSFAIHTDITERKRMEEALRQSEEKYRSLVESSEDSIYLVDSDCNYLFMNNKYLSRLGLQNSQVIGRTYDEFHSPEETKDFAQRVKNVFKTGESQSYEYRSQRDNRYFIRTLSPVESPDGSETTAITVISKDITDLKLAEEALRESDKFSSSLLNDAPHPIIVINPDTSIRYVNPALVNLTGFSAEELIGRKVPYPWWTKETLSKTSRDLAAAMRKGSQRLEEQFQKKTGERVWVEITSQPIIYDGEFQYYLGNWSDITERKQAEEMLREREAFNFALFQYNPAETIVVDLDGRITRYNLAKKNAGDRLPSIGDLMYKNYAGRHEIDMRAELMKCIRSDKIKEFPERKYGDKYLSITIAPFSQGALIISEDITKRKRAEEALRESEKFGASLLNESPNPIIVINPDTSIRYVNPALVNLTGFSAEELIGRKVPYPWWPKGTARRTTRDLQEAMRKELQRIEMNFQKKSGERFWVEITSIPAMRDGEVQYLLGNWIDITEPKQAEELLQKERDTFYSILQKAPYGVMLIDKDGNHPFVNPEFTNITGYTLEDIPTVTNWFRQAYPDPQYRNMVRETWRKDFKEREADEKFREKFKRVFSRAFNVVCKDGTTKEIEFSRAEIGDGGTIAMLADITERKRMHELLQTAAAEWRTTFDAISDSVCLLDQKGKIVRCNNAMLQLIGKPFSEITNHHCWEIMHGVLEAPHGCPITRIAKTHQREAEVFEKNSHWFNVSVDPLLDENGALVGGVHIMSDITDRKVIEDELQGSREQLRNLTAYLESVREQERTNIAREIHDELAQALTALKMDVSWLDHRLPSDHKSLLEKTQSMRDLVDTTIQTVKRISAELRPGILDDLGLVAAIEWQADEFHNRTGIVCHVTVDPQDITLDQDRSTTIFRIFQETLTNVARHAQASKVTVSLKEKAGTLILRVRDNGRGIAEGKISDPQSFGLIGMQERVHVWGGKVSFKGIPGKGTTVAVHVKIGEDKK